MQIPSELPQENETVDPHEDGECRESLYRTKWLAAHNRLHALAHGEAVPNWWTDYLAELEFADTEAKLLA